MLKLFAILLAFIPELALIALRFSTVSLILLLLALLFGTVALFAVDQFGFGIVAALFTAFATVLVVYSRRNMSG